MRTSGNLVFVPLRSENASTLRLEVFSVGRAAPFDNSAPAVAVHGAVAHKILGTVGELLWSFMSIMYITVNQDARHTVIDPVMFTEGSR